MKKNVLRLLALIIMSAMVLPFAAGCTKEPETKTDPTEAPEVVERYTGPYSDTDGTYGGIDDLGRKLTMDGETGEPNEKKVGIFYFVWQGEHGTSGPYDNYKIVLEHPDAIESESKWLKAGGGAQGAHHFWGKPLFGYYKSTDKWVMRRHLQMFIDAGIDFIVFDTTNAVIYTSRVRDLISVWYEYLEMGYNVPQLSFYTNTKSGETVNAIYKEIYSNKKLHEKYPRLDELFFQWDGKPMIVGDPYDKTLNSACKDYFRIKENVWPNDVRKDDGFPWMEFGRNMTDDAVYGINGRKEVVNVSIAQHDATCIMSATAWYGANDRTRSWHNGANDTSENAMYYCYNFIEQWEWALSVNPEMIFVTGWNEWVAQRQSPTLNKKVPVNFVDCCDPNTSRDAEPMEGLFGDNYYMTLVSYIRKYKGTKARVNIGENNTIDINGSFDQWNDSKITAKYTDYKLDAENRNERGFGKEKYVDETARNDFALIKTARDKENIYFYAQTVDAITPSTDDNWMTLFISSGNTSNELWANVFDFAVNLEKPNGNEVAISKYNGNNTWSKAGTGSMKVEGNQIMISVPRDVLGIPDNDGKCVLDLQFKWADNYQYDANGYLDFWSFYKSGDAAPYGRLTFVFSEKPVSKG